MVKRTKRKNNRVSKKRVSKKRVSKKRVSQKRVSRKKNKIIGRKFNKMIGGAAQRAGEEEMEIYRQIKEINKQIEEIYKKIDIKVETKQKFEEEKNREWVELLQREINGLESDALDLIEEREARARTLRHAQPGAASSSREPAGGFRLEGAASSSRKPAGGFRLEKPAKKFSQAPDDVKFVLIPGSSNIWGRERSDGVGVWQEMVEDIVGDSNILKSTREYNEIGDLHCGKNNNKPRWAALDRDSSGSEEMSLCIANTFENNAGAKKSVITTSQGSALFIDYIVEHPEMLENVHSIVFVSPATIAAGRSGLEFAGPQKTEIFLRLCEQKNKRILLLLTEHGWGRWGRWGEGREEDCVYDVTDEDTGMEKTILVADCSKIKKSRICDSLIVPGTTHSFDIYGEGGDVTPVPYILCETIIAWCRRPTPDMFNAIEAEVEELLFIS